MTSSRAGWDFHYEPSSAGYGSAVGDNNASLDVVVATSAAVEEAPLRRALRTLGPELLIEALVARAPLFWTRLRSRSGNTSISPQHVHDLLRDAAIEVRYVASARVGSMLVPPALQWTAEDRATAGAWAARAARPLPEGAHSEGHWFLGEVGGVRVDRRICGTGSGTRLAVLDNDGADLDHVELDRTVCVGTSLDPKAGGHAALMVGWATSARRPGGGRFVGLAPDASVRVYAIPKPDVDIVSLPLAMVEAVFDGADVIVCATYVEGTTSPMLDDALDVATHLGRSGLGSLVVLPTGRETSGAGGSVHASLSLEFGDPACDPRVHCVAPSGRTGGWFLWRSPRGKLRPFANRGPTVRWMAPGDDLAYPFSSRDRLFHAESSGASAIAAGVMLLVLGCNPNLEVYELHALLERSVGLPTDHDPTHGTLADPADVLPSGRDKDGHDAKCGYGRLDATRACAIATDPIAMQLVAMGEDERAIAWCVDGARPYSKSVGRWASQALLSRPDLEHSVRAVLRHVRLIAGGPPRRRAHAPGALARHLLLIVRELQRMPGPHDACQELVQIAEKLRLASTSGVDGIERAVCATFRELGGVPARSESHGFSSVSVQL